MNKEKLQKIKDELQTCGHKDKNGWRIIEVWVSYLEDIIDALLEKPNTK